ncbi:MAG: ABC transporter ATP-binding protein [Candidatus Thorarchaeota archaeon]
MEIPLGNYWRIQKKYMLPFKKRISALAFLMVTNVILQVINPQIIRAYIDIVTTSTGGDLFTEVALLYIAIAIIQQVALVTAVYIAQDLAWQSTNSLRADLFGHCVNLDMTFHNEHRPGDMIERIDGDMNTLSNFFSQFTILILTNIMVIGAIVVALFIENFFFGLAFLLFVLVAFVLIYKTQDIAITLWKKARDSTTKLLGMIEENLGGIEDIRANGARNNVMRKFHGDSKELYDMQMKASIKTMFFIGVIYALEALSLVLVFGIGIPFLQGGIFTIGTIVMLHLYAGLLLGPVIRILRQMQDLQLAGASIKRVQEMFERKSKISDDGKIELEDGPILLEFQDLSFEYKEGTPVLKRLSFAVEKGKVLGLIGPTGSGKTTISRLVFRLYNPTSGGIKVNDIELRDIPTSHLRKQVAMVTQSVEIFQASLRDNVTFFDSNIDDDTIIEVLKDVGLGAWFEKLPEGLDSKLKSDSGLSAGESQLLALTRVFLRNPSLVILDEASSRLDPVTERLVERAVDKLLKDRTAIIIAHRLSTLNRAHDILLLEDGEIAEFGNREKLAKDSSSRFYQLLQTGMMEVLV